MALTGHGKEEKRQETDEASDRKTLESSRENVGSNPEAKRRRQSKPENNEKDRKQGEDPIREAQKQEDAGKERSSGGG